MRSFFVGAVCVALLAGVQLAHAEKLDKNGCYNSASKGYVCPSQHSVQPWGHESEKDRTRRLKRECKGRPNAGACLGYAS